MIGQLLHRIRGWLHQDKDKRYLESGPHWREAGWTDEPPQYRLVHPSDDKGSDARPPEPVEATYAFPFTEGNPALAYALGHDCPLPPIPEVDADGTIGLLGPGVSVSLAYDIPAQMPTLRAASWGCPDCRRLWRLSSDNDYWYPVVSKNSNS